MSVLVGAAERVPLVSEVPIRLTMTLVEQVSHLSVREHHETFHGVHVAIFSRGSSKYNCELSLAEWSEEITEHLREESNEACSRRVRDNINIISEEVMCGAC